MPPPLDEQAANRSGQNWPPPWAERIRDFSEQIVPKNFTGKIVLNFCDGGTTRVQIEGGFK